MTRTSLEDFNCSLARTADIIGDKWTLLILRDAFFGAFHRGRRRLLGEVERASGPWGVLGEPWPTGATAMWAALLLFLYLVVYY